MNQKSGNYSVVRTCGIIAIALLFAFVYPGIAQNSAGAGARMIPELKITSLQKELGELGGKRMSAVRKRRACKNIVRDGDALLKASPTASNRFHVLDIMLQSQKQLVSLENTSRNRDALFETCERLVEAPDEYAELRLEADFLLSDRDLSAKNADLKERAVALGQIVARYRDTSAEAKSLMMAALIAPKLEALELEEEILATMSERFAGDPVVIGWRRKNLGISQLDVLFTGSFNRTDGTLLSFPVDGMGHTCLMVFWSKDSPGVRAQLMEFKELQGRNPDQLKIFSFNVDELPDAGEKMLRTFGLDWTALHLPGGKHSQTYLAYARRDPIGIRVNAHGHAFVRPDFRNTEIKDTPMEMNLDDPRYLAQLQSLFIGDFLVGLMKPGGAEDESPGSVPVEKLNAIQHCFIPAPMRYRLSVSQALANYTKAERLCREIIKEHSNAPNLWFVRSHRIIALLGMWNLTTEPKHLGQAIVEANSLSKVGQPSVAKIVAQFCAAKLAMREGTVDLQPFLSEMIKVAEGDDGMAAVHAVAVVLALETNDRELYEKHRSLLLGAGEIDPALFSVTSFLRDQNHLFRLFKGNYYHPPSRARRIVRENLRSNAANLDAPLDRSRTLRAEFKTLEGDKLSLPEGTDGQLTFLVFVEPPADPDATLPTLINGEVREDARGKKTEIKGVMQLAFEFADQHVRKDLKVITAFLNDDATGVAALVEKHQWPGQSVVVPNGLRNRVVRELGILGADRVPNVSLLRPDGTVAWALSGLVHPQLKAEGTNELLHAISRAMKSNIEKVEVERSIAALEKGDYEEAVLLFSGPLPPPARPYPDGWTVLRLHGRAVAYCRIKDWESALKDIDAAIEAHQWVYNSKRICECQRVGDLLLAKSNVLKRLERGDEAKEVMLRQEAAKIVHSESRYGVLHDRIEAVNRKEGK